MTSPRAAEWLAEAKTATLAPLRFPPPAPLFPHQDIGARRLVLLLSRFGGALLLDGVGMGKSFTASAAARELARVGWTIHLAVPAPLVPAWSGCLARFGIDGAILTHDTLDSAVQPVVHPSLLVVDEAHRFRNASTRRWRALARWSIGRAILLITATPIWNQEADLWTLLRLAFRDDALASEGIASIDRAFERKDWSVVRSIVSLTALRRTEEVERVRFPGARRTVVRYRQQRRAEIAAAIRSLRFPLVSGSPALLEAFLLGRLDSSLAAFLDSLGRQRRFCRRATESARRGYPMRRRHFQQLFPPEDRDYFQDLLFPEAFLEPGSDRSTDLELLAGELERIDSLIELVGSLEDGKQGRLLSLLESSLPRPAILFTRSRATAVAIYRAVSPSIRCALITSSMVLDVAGCASTMKEVLGHFGGRLIELLVLTDLASEGLDLQAAGSVIHYDLPWTAVKMEQRTGRARRIGQTRTDVRNVCFLPEKPDRPAALSFIGRKHRLGSRLLHPELVACAGGSPPYQPCVAATIGRFTLVVKEGVSRMVEEGRVTADPVLIRPLLTRLIEPEGDSLDANAREAPPPARVAKALRPFAFSVRVRDSEVLSALAVRNRSGIEALMAEGLAGEALEKIKAAVAADERIVQRGD